MEAGPCTNGRVPTQRRIGARSDPPWTTVGHFSGGNERGTRP